MAVRVPSFFAPILTVILLPGRLPVTSMQSSRVRKILTGRPVILASNAAIDRVLSDLKLGAEAAAHVVADDPHVRQRQAHGPGHALLDAVHALGGIPDGEPVAVPSRHGTVWLHRRVNLTFCPIGAFHHDVGVGESGSEVAAFAHGSAPRPCCRRPGRPAPTDRGLSRRR